MCLKTCFKQVLTLPCIFFLFSGLDVSEDHEFTPKHVCLPCKVRLDKSKLRKDKKKGGVLKWDIPEFSCGNDAFKERDKDGIQVGRGQKRKHFGHFRVHLHNVANLEGFVDCSEKNMALFVTLKGGNVQHKVIIHDDFSWEVLYDDIPIPKTSKVLCGLPDRLDEASACVLFHSLACSTECKGDATFGAVMKLCKDANTTNILAQDKSVLGYIDKHGAVRSAQCHILFEGHEKSLLCGACAAETFRGKIRSKEVYLHKRQAKVSRVSSSSRVPFALLQPNEKEKRLVNLSRSVQYLQKKNKRLNDKMAKMIEDQAIDVTKNQHDFLDNTMKENSVKVHSLWPEDSCQRILWEQQAKCAQVKSASGMRWHPMMVRWCIALHAKSASAYRQLSNSGFLRLPHVTTLQSYMRFSKPRSGLNKEVLDLLAQEMNLSQMKDYQTNVCLNWDEMKIKSGLVLSKSTGKLVGFCELDNFNEELCKLSSTDTEFKAEIASHILVFMVRGLFTSHNVPFI